jgi:hypothetical protein
MGVAKVSHNRTVSGLATDQGVAGVRTALAKLLASTAIEAESTVSGATDFENESALTQGADPVRQSVTEPT